MELYLRISDKIENECVCQPAVLRGRFHKWFRRKFAKCVRGPSLWQLTLQEVAASPIRREKSKRIEIGAYLCVSGELLVVPSIYSKIICLPLRL